MADPAPRDAKKRFVYLESAILGFFSKFCFFSDVGGWVGRLRLARAPNDPHGEQRAMGSGTPSVQLLQCTATGATEEQRVVGLLRCTATLLGTSGQ